MGINRRLYGSDISTRIKDKLTARQAYTQKVNPLESIDEIATYLPSIKETQIYKDTAKLLKDYKNETNFNALGELSSRTPFIRMWTCVGIYEMDRIEDTYSYVDPKDIPPYRTLNPNTPGLPRLEQNGKAPEGSDMPWQLGYVEWWIEHKFKNYEVDEVYYDSDTKRYVAKGEYKHAGTNFAQRIYSIGNHTLNTIGENPTPGLGLSVLDPVDGQVKRQSLDTGIVSDTATVVQENAASGDKVEYSVDYDTAPLVAEQSSNVFLKPAAGITGCTSETMDYGSTYGFTKKTTVNFVVHNFHDFENIYHRYFLQPGAFIFIDFGWDNADLYDPHDIIDGKYTVTENGQEQREAADVEEMLYGVKGEFSTHGGHGGKSGNRKKLKRDGFVTESNGDMDTIFGQVTNFESKIIEDGSIECSVEVVSKNSALLGHGFEKAEKINTVIEEVIDNVVLLEGLRQELDDEILEELDFIYNEMIENGDDEAWKRTMKELSLIKLKAPYDIPGVINSQTGVFRRGDQTYITLGIFEDLVLNMLFGSGIDLQTINAGLDLSVGMDSGHSFTHYIDSIAERQKFNADTSHHLSSPGYNYETDKFLYPTDWNGMKKTKRFWKRTYAQRLKKYPHEKYPLEGRLWHDKYGLEPWQYMDLDKKFKRCPVREIFISCDYIKEQFAATQNKTVYSAVKGILDGINENSNFLLNLQLSNQYYDGTKISIVDQNYLDVVDRTHDETESDIFEGLFEFDVMGGNSIVTGYDLAFNIGDDDHSRLMAIKGMDIAEQLVVRDKGMARVLSIESLNSITDRDRNKKIIQYLPKIGNHRAKVISNQHLFSEVVGDKIDSILLPGRNIYTEDELGDVVRNRIEQEENARYTLAEIYNLDEEKEQESGKSKTGWGKINDPNSPENKKYKFHTRKINTENDKDMMKSGVAVAQSFEDWYNLQAFNDYMFSEVPNLLPAELSLTIYGISTLAPGDMFRVNYLPEMYAKNVYFQVINVSHQLGEDGWYTTLQTLFRLRPERKQKSDKYFYFKDAALSANRLLEMSGKGSINLFNRAVDPAYRVATNFAELSRYMYNIQPITTGDLEHISFALKFTANVPDGKSIKVKFPYNIFGGNNAVAGHWYTKSVTGNELDPNITDKESPFYGQRYPGAAQFAMWTPADIKRMRVRGMLHILVGYGFWGPKGTNITRAGNCAWNGVHKFDGRDPLWPNMKEYWEEYAVPHSGAGPPAGGAGLQEAWLDHRSRRITLKHGKEYIFVMNKSHTKHLSVNGGGSGVGNHNYWVVFDPEDNATLFQHANAPGSFSNSTMFTMSEPRNLEIKDFNYNVFQYFNPMPAKWCGGDPDIKDSYNNVAVYCNEEMWNEKDNYLKRTGGVDWYSRETETKYRYNSEGQRNYQEERHAKWETQKGIDIGYEEYGPDGRNQSQGRQYLIGWD